MLTHSQAKAFLVVRSSSPSPPLNEEIACYSLPYGALGFVSHFLTYYTITCLCAGRKPLWPFRKIAASKFDIILGSISLCVTTTLAIITLVRCRHSWQLVTIGIWKLGMSWLNTGIGLTTGIVAFKEERKKRKEEEEERMGNAENRNADCDQDRNRNDEQALAEDTGVEMSARPATGLSAATTTRPEKERVFDLVGNMLKKSPYTAAFWWGLLYAYSLIVGMVGLISLLVKHWSEARGPLNALTVIFFVMGLLVLLATGLLLDRITPKVDESDPRRVDLRHERRGTIGTVLEMGIIIISTVFSAWYCDWALGIMTGNLAGLPSKDNSGFYWTYFIFKRLTMLSS
ncbi:hypothetical protein BDN72DRAFT_845221 [Pluteus cervinus]|uniref:Uncharacterized protein n=1 Tax=Pluteus cervinus TaxID=181527 RepID=A0ACD3AJR4_9AGAR|nr:hypothetical protein BDN72DRAFT_845221 [Pluteus cervinus]